MSACRNCNWFTNTESEGQGCVCDFNDEKCIEHQKDEAYRKGYTHGTKILAEYKKKSQDLITKYRTEAGLYHHLLKNISWVRCSDMLPEENKKITLTNNVISYKNCYLQDDEWFYGNCNLSKMGFIPDKWKYEI